MRIISNFFYFSLSLLFFILNFAPYSYGIGNVDWVLLKENNEGKEWLDKGQSSLKIQLIRMMMESYHFM